MTEDARRPAARWFQDLAMGVRFAVVGGREGWLRTALTALGVGLGVVVLLLAASIPHAIRTSMDRDRFTSTASATQEPPSRGSVLVGRADGAFGDRPIQGVLLKPEGPAAPVPPGLDRLPRPGEMVVTPALAELLASPGGALLRERYQDYRVTGRIGDEAGHGTETLAFYAGSDALRPTDDGSVERATAFESARPPFDPPPLMLLMIVVGCVALLVPVAVFIATAVRLGGERRERRLAALRLVGADRATTSRIAAGEALAGSLLGLAVGLAVFLICRQLLSGLELFSYRFYARDVTPDAGLAAFIALAVPVTAVAVTLFALRTVAVEPLRVVRPRPQRRRRLWWRLLLPLTGAAVLLSLYGPGRLTGDRGTALLALGASLLILGVAALMPWLVQAVAARAGRGAPSWQLALRRLQLSGSAAARPVSAITVAVAGAIAVQVLLGTAVADMRETVPTPRPTDHYTVQSWSGVLPADRAPELFERLRAVEGVRSVDGAVSGPATLAGSRSADPPEYRVTVADCATLRQLAETGRCADGDVFLPQASGDSEGPGGIPPDTPRPGARLLLGPREGTRSPTPWTVPATAPRVPLRLGPSPLEDADVLATPGALDPTLLPSPLIEARVRTGPGHPAAVEHLRNAAARFDLRTGVFAPSGGALAPFATYSVFRAALAFGALAVMALIGTGLLISVLGQLHERRRLLSALNAFGTPHATLGWSIVWQTAVPVALGLGLAVVCGLGLGLLLLGLVGSVHDFTVDWLTLAALTGSAAAAVLAVTALSLPILWRAMRPDGLRTE